MALPLFSHPPPGSAAPGHPVYTVVPACPHQHLLCSIAQWVFLLPALVLLWLPAKSFAPAPEPGRSCVQSHCPKLMAAVPRGSLFFMPLRFCMLFLRPQRAFPPFCPWTPASSSRNHVRGFLPALSGFIIHAFSFPLGISIWVPRDLGVSIGDVF